MTRLAHLPKPAPPPLSAGELRQRERAAELRHIAHGLCIEAVKLRVGREREGIDALEAVVGELRRFAYKEENNAE